MRSPDWYQVTAAWVDDDAIATATAGVTSTTAATTLTGAGLDGVVGAAEIAPTKAITVTTSSTVGAWSTTRPFVITGTDWSGKVITENLQPTVANGNQTLTSTKAYRYITSVVCPIQPLATGTFKVGVGDIFFEPVAQGIQSDEATDPATYKLVTGTGRSQDLLLNAGDFREVAVKKVLTTQADFPFTIFR